MTKKGLVISTAVLALLLPSAARAQAVAAATDSPAWLRDRRYNEGIGVRSGDLELHPGVAGEVGYDSNWFLRSDRTGFENSAPTAPVVPALEFRITPSLYLSTLGPQRKEGDVNVQPESVRFRAGVNATYREYIGLSSDGGQNNAAQSQRNVAGAADMRLDIAPERPFGVGLMASFVRNIQPNAADPNLSFNRDDVGAGGEFIVQPASGTLDWHFGYQFHDAIFEDSVAQQFANTTHEAFTRGRWRFRPRTALLYDATFRFINYTNPGAALSEGLVNSTPVRARLGLSGLVTDRFALLAMAGWGASFYDKVLVNQAQYDSVIGQAELKWFLSASPGLQQSSDVGLSLSSIAVGYTRDFQNSYLGGYYGSDRGYLRFAYFFAGRALLTLEGGAAAIEYPNLYWGTGDLRHSAFTDVRADGTLFGEYRFTDSIGLNATVRYTANFSNAVLPTFDNPTTTNAQSFDMSWTRLEAFLGVRWFM
jgi:hypothetical protein